MRFWFRRGRRGRGEERTALNPPPGDAATAPEPTQAPAENPPGEPQPTQAPAEDRAAEPEPLEAPAAAVKEAKPGHRSKHGKKDARATASSPADPFDRALDRLRTEIPKTDEDGSR